MILEQRWMTRWIAALALGLGLAEAGEAFGALPPAVLVPALRRWKCSWDGCSKEFPDGAKYVQYQEAHMRFHRKNSNDATEKAGPSGPLTLRQIGRQVALDSTKTVTQSLVNSLFRSGASRVENPRSGASYAENLRLESLRMETERLDRINTAVRMREEWDRRDAEMSQRLDGVFDIPVRRSTPSFGIEGNPDDEAVAQALAEDSDPWRGLFDGSHPGEALRRFEGRLREGGDEGSRLFEVEAGDVMAPLGEDLRDVVIVQGAPRGATFIPVPSPELTALLQGVERVNPTPVQPHDVVLGQTPIRPQEVTPRTIPHLLVIGPSEIRHLTVIRRGCKCGAGDCTCISPICGGTKGCGCKSVSGSRCGCNGPYCKRSVRSCCNGTHPDGGGSQACDATCVCAAGLCKCTVSCGCAGKK